MFFSLYHVIVRLTKLIKDLLKDCKIWIFSHSQCWKSVGLKKIFENFLHKFCWLSGFNIILVGLKWDDIKSINLQYIMLGWLDDGTNQSSTKSLMFQVQWNLDLRKPDLRKNLDLRKIGIGIGTLRIFGFHRARKMSNQVGDCFKFLWPFQNIRTLIKLQT